MTAQQSKVHQFESTGFQDPQTAAVETSGSYYYSSDGEAGAVVRVVASKRKVRGERKGDKKGEKKRNLLFEIIY